MPVRGLYYNHYSKYLNAFLVAQVVFMTQRRAIHIHSRLKFLMRDLRLPKTPRIFLKLNHCEFYI